MLLLLRQLLWHRDARDDVEIAVAAAAHVRHALVTQLEARPGLRAGGYVHFLTAIKRRHFHRPPERESGEAHWHLAVEVILFTMKERVLLHVDDDVQVSLRPAGAPVFSFAIEPKPLAGCDAGGNLDRDLAFAGDPPGAAARRAGLGDRLARAAAVRTWPRNGEESLLIPQLPRPLALAAGLRRRAFSRTGAVAGLAGLFAGNL